MDLKCGKTNRLNFDIFGTDKSVMVHTLGMATLKVYKDGFGKVAVFKMLFHSPHSTFKY